jgi:hypothetical protein
MSRNEARYKYTQEPETEGRLQDRKQQLEEEFQSYLKRKSQPANFHKQQNKSANAEIGMKSLLDEFLRENTLKEGKCIDLHEKHQRSTISYNPGRVILL